MTRRATNQIPAASSDRRHQPDQPDDQRQLARRRKGLVLAHLRQQAGAAIGEPA